VSNKLHLYKFGEVLSHCARLIQGAQVNTLRSIDNKQLIWGCELFEKKNYGNCTYCDNALQT